jgi:lactate dehydrogenase-like 2-hydroxyacid dehydrogenase
MITVAVLERFRTIALAHLPGEVKIVDCASHADAVILDARLFRVSDFPSIKAISRVGVGIDNVDFSGISENNKPALFTTPCLELTNAVAEFTVRQILILIRRASIPARNLSELSVGVIGFGRIGRRVCDLLYGFKCKKFIYDEDFGSILRGEVLGADIVTIHVSGSPLIVGKEEIGQMKDGSFLVNMARAGCVDEGSVWEALRSGRLAGFATDVNPDFLVKGVENKVLKTPHIASDTLEARTAMEKMAVNNILRFFGLEEI